MKHFDNV